MKTQVVCIVIALSLIVFGCKKDNDIPSTVTDIEGNVYHTVIIGTQVWMVENLKTTMYSDSTTITLVTDHTAWANLGSPGYCWFNNDPSTYKNPYGALYNWYAVSTGKLAPAGWHVPTDAEWATLISYLGGEGSAGGKLKEAGTTHWRTPNAEANNQTGFTALPGGDCGIYGACVDVGNYGLWWSSTPGGTGTAWYRYIGFDRGIAGRYKTNVTNGFSVRCIRD